ncbi:MAG: putative Phosphotransferase [Candidatus Binatus sp.]|nr:putative Phosphotransferase [Candidatus Binatus sp.]
MGFIAGAVRNGRAGFVSRAAERVGRISCQMKPGLEAFEAFASSAIAKRWPGAEIEKIIALRGDANFSRRFWRVSILSPHPGEAPNSAILVDLGPDDLPRYVRTLNLLTTLPTEPPWINVHRFLSRLGAPVPALYDLNPNSRAMLVEDVGDLPLLQAVRQPGAKVADLYRIAVEELLRLHVEGTGALDARCIAHDIQYSGQLFEWELKEFLEIGISTIASSADVNLIGPELSALASQLDRYPRVFSHRDYHGDNLFVQNGLKIRIIDFQDALMAPAAQDLAVLLTTRATGDLITPILERRLLEFYWTGLVRRGAANISMDELITAYRRCVLQHALKMIGRFEMFARDGKTDYRAYIPHCIAQARRMLAAMPTEFPNLRIAMGA